MQNSKCNAHEANPQDVEVMESKDVFSNKSGIEQELRDIVEFLEQCEKEENPDEYMNKVIAGVEEFDSKTGIVNSRVKNIGDLKKHKEQFCALVAKFYIEFKERDKDNNKLDIYYSNIRKEGNFLLQIYKGLREKL